MNIYMLCDMEGVSGIYTREHVWHWEAGVRPAVAEEGRRLLTADVNASSAAALEAGADRLVVCDTHHGGGNFIWEALLADPRVSYETPQSSVLMPSLDDTFDGLMLLGHHAKAGTQGAFLDHTWGPWFDFQINGLSVGEIGIEACYAGHWDVPLILVQGDEACCAEAEAQFPAVLTAAVKRGLDFNRAVGPAPEIGRQLTAEKVAESIERLRNGHFRPYKPTLPMAVRVTARITEEADRVARRPGVRRLDARSVEASVEQQNGILSWIVN